MQLVSASESIDDTPAGMLFHGIMSSIAEFYSQNLATEVKKGMTEKAPRGGTISRAPLVKLAFEEYAAGNWTVDDLAEHLAACGLTTRATPNIPSNQLTGKHYIKCWLTAITQEL